ncbi:heavy metal translocating P-type ATPase [Paenibacillus aurantiacus]|uniref:P-type Cu(+) transporter n=1 Tax=Paenibacillus aurantiacus TaxID=1936118 RepID=A0ABV5KZE6_9BACL
MKEQHPHAVLDIAIHGMSCTACAARIEKGLGKLAGVDAVSVHYAGKSGSIRYASGVIEPQRIIERVSELGFRAAPYGTDDDGAERDKLLLRLLLSVVLSLPLLVAMLHHYEWLSAVPIPAFVQEPLLQFVLAAVVQFGIGMPFYFNAYYALRERTANMDVLVAVGTTAAFGYSYYAMLAGWPLYFETSAVVITAVLLGKWLEAAISDRALQAAIHLGRLQLTETWVLRGGSRVKIPVQELRVSETMLPEQGQPLAADGIVVRGQASVDESFLTGESMPAAKGEGDAVFAGTIVVGGEIAVRAQAVGDGTMLSRIAALTRQAQSSKSSIGRRVDALSAIFVPAMLLLATATLLIWLLFLDPGNLGNASLHALAVLLAACPCALGLAAPISLVIASGRLARRGIVMKEAGVLERLAGLDTVVLDKTGTLTEGRPQLVDMQLAPGMTKRALLRDAASAEQGAKHPFGQALLEQAAAAGVELPAERQFREIAGKGVEAVVDGRRVEVGSAVFAEERGLVPTAAIEAFARRSEQAGRSVLYVYVGGQAAGALAFVDPIKRTSRDAVQRLRKAGIEPILATGDHPAPAWAAAQEAGIERVYASLLPADKQMLIERLRRENRRAAMAGDGWNDAPALAAADVGIAMGNGTDAALAAGHMALIRARLTGIADAVAISRLTLRNIRQNLGFAFVYNACVIPFAAFGGLEPWMAGTAMAFSSVSVVGNALRLNRQLRKIAD